MTSQLPRVEGFEGHSLTVNKGEEVALLLPALHSTPPPPVTGQIFAERFLPVTLLGGVGTQKCVTDSSWPQAAQRLTRDNRSAQKVMLGGRGQGLGCTEGSRGAAMSHGFWEQVGSGCVSRAVRGPSQD